MKTKLATITVDVPYKRAGNVILQQPVSFDVYRDDEIFRLMPLLDGPELALANLPVELSFIAKNGKVVSTRGSKDSNVNVMQDAFDQLQKMNNIFFR